jgi:signal transduction histidine kinase
MMTIQLSLMYLAILVMSLELVLLGYGYQANPRALTNRVFALLMLALAVSAASMLLMTAVPSQRPFALWLHAFAIFCATPLLAWLLLLLLAPEFRYKRTFLLLIGSWWLFSISLLILGIFVPGNLVFQAKEATDTSYVSLAAFLTGRFGPLLYGWNVKYTHALFPLLILLALLTGVVPPDRRALAWRLLGILLLLFVVNGLVWWVAPEIVGLVGSLSVALIVTWAIVRYQILSPSPAERQKALETAVRQAQSNLEAANQSLEKLVSESQRQAQQLQVLNDLSGRMVGLVSVQELTDLVVNRLWADFHYDNVVIFMVDAEKEQEMILQSVAGAYAHLDKFRQPVSVGIIGQVVTTGQPVLENDTLSNPHFFQPPGFNIRAELAVPIKTTEATLGALNIDSRLPYAFSQADVALVATVADQLAVAIQKARLFEQTLQRTRELEVLSVVSARLRAAHTVQEMLPIILENTVEALGAAVGVIYLVDPPHHQVVSRAVYPANAYPLGLTHQFGQGITGRVAATGDLYVAANLQKDPHLYRHDGEEAYLAKLQSGIALPLRTEQMVLGVIHLGLPEQRHFTPFEIQLLTSISDIAANALHRAGVMESLEERVAERTRELQLAYGRLQELDRLKSKFISDVTHELRTPVANLNLYLDLLKVGRPEKQQQYMHVIESQTARLTQLVETTMQAPDPEVVIEPADFTAVSLAEVVMTAAKPYISRAQAAEVDLTLSITPNLPPVWGNAEQLARVASALLANAVNYTQQGQITVSLTADLPTQMACLQITDTGIGIEEDEMPYIFDRFYRGRKVGQLTIPGVGLGLALAKEIVERHDGRIDMQSAPGIGTSCTVWLPLKEINGEDNDETAPNSNERSEKDRDC